MAEFQQLALDPLVSQPSFSVASRSISAAISALTDGRPDHRPLKARLRPMRGLKRHHSAPSLAPGHAFVQNLRRGHYNIATEVPSHHRLRVAFDDLPLTI